MFCAQKWVTILWTHLYVSLLCLLPWFYHVKHIPAHLCNRKTFLILTAPGFIWCIHAMMLRIWTWSLKDIIHGVKGNIKSVWLSTQLIVANSNIIHTYICIQRTTNQSWSHNHLNQLRIMKVYLSEVMIHVHKNIFYVDRIPINNQATTMLFPFMDALLIFMMLLD